jgi:CheY-like chemotaxis protein
MQDDMLGDFYIEADELFNESEEALLNIERKEDFQENFNCIFRAFHSVKGAAGMFGLNKLQEHMHFLENLLEKKKGQDAMSAKLVDYLLNGVDGAKRILQGEEIDFSYYDPDNEEGQVYKATSQQVKDVKVIDDKLKDDIKKSVQKKKEIEASAGMIFVVDDEDDILELTQVQLEEYGYTVECFSNPLTALEELNNKTPDLIITDISMPQMNGILFMQKVNRMKIHLPIIVVSGYVTKDVCIQSLACGVSGILEKPYDSDIFRNMIHVCIDRYKAFKIMNKSIDLLVYQFEDFDKYFTEKGDITKRDIFRKELKSLLKQKKILVDKARA